MKKTLVALGITSAALVLLGALFALTTKKEKSGEPLRLIYWNIQNGILQVKKKGDVMSKEVYLLLK